MRVLTTGNNPRTADEMEWCAFSGPIDLVSAGQRLLLGRGERGSLQVCVYGGRPRGLEQPLGQHDHGEGAPPGHEERCAEPTLPAARARPLPPPPHPWPQAPPPPPPESPTRTPPSRG